MRQKRPRRSAHGETGKFASELQPFFVYLSDMRQGWSAVGPGDKGREVIATAFGHDLDRAVDEIARIACDTEDSRGVGRLGSEHHSLHPTLDAQAHAGSIGDHL